MQTIDIQEQILDKLNTLIVVLNRNGDVEYVSKYAEQLLGFYSDELLGNAWWEVTRFSQAESKIVKQKILDAFRYPSAKTQMFEHELKTALGGRKWVRWNISDLNEEQLIAVGYDITDTKLNEKRLIENNKQLQEQNNDIKDSIHYAQRIQQSILQTPDQLKNIFSNSFLLYKPKDIVSGDYYWFYEDTSYKYIAVVDCTGHGVPGAMMSMVANSIFKEVFINQKISEPATILNALDFELEKAVNKNQDQNFNDGMDIALVRISKINNTLEFSGAFRSILIVRKNTVIELKGNRYPIGFYSDIEKQFNTEKFELQRGDSVYMYTDGFIDQFGGEKQKKLNKSNFKDLLLTIGDMTMSEQEAFLEYSFNNWKQDLEQTDDVLVLGFCIN